MERDWKPRRNGKYYCSPACGGGKFCLHKDYLKAKERAAKLCALLGPAWRPRLTENLGWHYSAVLENMEVCAHIYKDKIYGYTCFYNGPQQFLGEHPSDPRKAVVLAFHRAQRTIEKLVAANEAIKRALQKPRLAPKAFHGLKQ